MKKILIVSIILLVCGLSVMVIFFYTLSTPKYKDVSKEEPFVEIVNKKLTTKRHIQILKDPDTPIHADYSYHLEDGNTFGMDSGLEIIAEIPIGTEITIDKSELHTGRVSGTTTAYLFGTIHLENTQQTYAFQYSWGHYHTLYEDTPYWTFDLAFWQDTALANKYIIAVP
ncbi:hypothetical protein [Formosa algae]|uniref:Uncharacterized protein n=1 Tax=Formosa algae TaxID=225843 RepID=A0A9X0YKE5_9FLAO|nr:hypothetical protein [Formosa algae]MBP1840720.1 hypothetical protein [Formosa algae]MDQ0335867.1 hypothetical protein [Formosa algae]